MTTPRKARWQVASAVVLALLVGEGVSAQLRGEAASEEEAEPGEVFFDELTVRELAVVLRVIDSHGAPVLGLEAGDLRVTVGGEAVPVAGLTWHSSDPSTFQAEGEDASEEVSSGPATEVMGAEETGAIAPREPPGQGYEDDGKLVVVFVQMGHHEQVTLDESWVGGYMKVLPSLRRLVRGLPERDRVAVVSFDSRLKLRQDFSRDREATAERLWDAVGFGYAHPQRSAEGPSLLDAWDPEAARGTTSPEEGLWVLAEALEPLPGAKEVVFVGWGLGRYTAGFVTMPPVYDDAVRSLLRAQATVHGLNVVQADGNALSAGVQSLTRTTGGTYAAIFGFGRNRVERLGRVLAGHYLLTLDPGDFPGVEGYLRVRLREEIEGRDVRIHHRRLRFVKR